MMNKRLLLGAILWIGTVLNLMVLPSKADDWFPFDPPPDPFANDCAIDLRRLNEDFAGEHGFITVKNGDFIHTQGGGALRFWAVNGPPHELIGDGLKRCARLLSKYGVNLARIHGGYFDESGEVDPKKVQHAFEMVAAMRTEGIYTHFSVYFPLWLSPQADWTWLKGYDGKQHPFGALFFNPEFQAQYRKWLTALLTTPNPATGKMLVDEPAVAALELQNEDSLFFWTFAESNIPPAELRLAETQFGDWLKAKDGTLDAVFTRWKAPKLKRDQPAEGRIAFRPLWQMMAEKTIRDQDTAQFLFELQTKFYTDAYAFVRRLGFKGAITASNWSTASPEVFGPLEKLSYTAGDFVDRHGYFSCNHKGQFAEWSLRDGQTYSDRSALRFDAEDLNQPKQFAHPAMDPHYNGLPSMISETTWTRPNRFRSEAPLYLASYGALQHSDAIVHFALDGAQWSVKPGFWMQPWTVMSPAMMGQFPAAALIYRRGLVREGDRVVKVQLDKKDLLRLKGTPLPQDAALDELRLKDMPQTTQVKPGQRIDPLYHYIGRTDVTFSNGPAATWIADVSQWIDHSRRTVKSSTGELSLDYGLGFLKIDAPKAQGVSGSLRAAGQIETADLIFRSELELGHLVMVALDDQPIATSQRLLLQVMSEEKAAGFETETVSAAVQRIRNIGHNPWMAKELNGTVTLKRSDAQTVRVVALDFNGYPVSPCGTAQQIHLKPRTVYYLLTASRP